MSPPAFDTLARLLRTGRMTLGKSLADVQQETRVPRHALAALEGGRVHELPAGPVTKGFALAYARAVGVDVAEVNVCWPSANVAVPKRASPPRLRSTWRWVVLLVLLLVPLWLLGRWLSGNMHEGLGEAGQASWRVTMTLTSTV